MFQSLIALLQLIRVPNLLLLALAVYIYTTRIILVPFAKYDIFPLLAGKDLWLFLFIIVCVCAAGYVHNDIVDIGTDQENEKRGYIGLQISKSIAWAIYYFFLFSALPLVYSLSMEVGNTDYVFVFLIVHLLLYLYNRFFKNWPVIGNIIVAALCSSVIILPYIVEQANILTLQKQHPEVVDKIYCVTIIFVCFTFVTHLIREIVKDAQDYDGDLKYGASTVPILLKFNATKKLLIAMQITYGIYIAYWIISTPHITSMKWVYAVILLIPMTMSLYYTFRAQQFEEYAKTSSALKFLMLSGILSLGLIS